MSDPIKQHYVPKVYLKYFTNEDGYLNIYDLKKDQIRKQTPKKTALVRHFYTVDVDGKNDYTIENIMAREVETLYDPVICKIENKEPLTVEDKLNLATFIAFQYLRTPTRRNNYNHMIERFQKDRNKIIFELKKVNGQLDHLGEKEIEKTGEIIMNEDYDVNVSKHESLNFMLNHVGEMSLMLSNHNLLILEASKKSEFITSDNPYCMIKENWEDKWRGYGIVNTVKYFPLTPKYLLILKDPGDSVVYMKTDKVFVRKLNLLICKWADNLIFSKNRVLLENIAEKIRNKNTSLQSASK